MRDQLLDVREAAAVMGTTVRFPRRLIEERRIEYVKLGTHVRIYESVVREYIRTHTVPVARRHLRAVS